MGLNYGDQITFKGTSLVARELISTLQLIGNKSSSSRTTRKRIDCDVSNIIHYLSFKHSSIFSTALVNDVALFLKTLAADSGCIITPILDGDIRPQSKRDAFKRRYESTMNRVNSYFCRQYAMKLAAKGSNMTNEEKNEFHLFNKEAKALESSTRLQVPSNLLEQLDSTLMAAYAYSTDLESGGYVSQNIIKAEFEANYIMTYWFRNGLSDLVFSTDADMATLCGPDSIAITYFGEEKDKKKRKRNNERGSSPYIYNIKGGSNDMMHNIESHISSYFPFTMSSFKAATYPLLEERNPFTLALMAVAIGCDVLPGGIKGVTPLIISKQITKMN